MCHTSGVGSIKNQVCKQNVKKVFFLLITRELILQKRHI